MKVTRNLALALGIPALYFVLQIACASMVSFYFYVHTLTSGRYDLSDMSVVNELMLQALEKSTAAMVPIMILSSAVFLVILVASYHNKPYRVWDAVRLSRNVPGRVPAMSFVAGFGFNLLCVGLMSVLPVPEEWNAAHDQITDNLFSGDNIGLTILFTVIAAPLIEEIIFRGYTHRYIERMMPAGAAAFVSGAVFGIFHFNWLQTIYAFAMGVMLGFIYSWSKNLLTTISFHMAFNGANFITMPVLAAIYGELEDIVPLPAALVMTAVGAVMSVYGVKRLYENRILSDVHAGPAVQD